MPTVARIEWHDFLCCRDNGNCEGKTLNPIYIGFFAPFVSPQDVKRGGANVKATLREAAAQRREGIETAEQRQLGPREH